MAILSIISIWPGPRADEIQLDLLGDYKSNVAAYQNLPKLLPDAQPALPGGGGEERSPSSLKHASHLDMRRLVTRYAATTHRGSKKRMTRGWHLMANSI